LSVLPHSNLDRLIPNSGYLNKAVLTKIPHGQPFDLAKLAAQGVSPQLAAKYARHGWLQRLAQGTYAFRNDALQLDTCLLFLQEQAASLHVWEENRAILARHTSQPQLQIEYPFMGYSALYLADLVY
jgi:hypothetical protein